MNDPISRAAPHDGGLRPPDDQGQLGAGGITERLDLHDRIERDFKYHAPTDAQVPKYNEIRDRAREYAHRLVDLVPPGRELSVALTKLEECVMAANAGIARNG
jgi:hypothetical protein